MALGAQDMREELLNEQGYWQVSENYAVLAEAGSLYSLVHISTGEKLGQYPTLHEATRQANQYEMAPD